MAMIYVANEVELLNACSGHTVLGFHGTTSLACERIETYGFLPHKVLAESEHEGILCIASSLGIDTAGYTDWLRMRSVTFAKHVEDAISHVKNGSSGGQGLRNIQVVLGSIAEHGDNTQKEVVQRVNEKILLMRKAVPVVYAVDLSGLGPRLVNDQHQPFYQYYWNPDAPWPKSSDIDQSRLVARLIIV